MIIENICEWNESRGLTQEPIDVSLEYEMIKEELIELLVADTRVDVADALADIIFVAVGSLYKLAGTSDKVKDILMVVQAANDLKKSDTVGGKITKPEGFVGPEKMIEVILNG